MVFKFIVSAKRTFFKSYPLVNITMKFKKILTVDIEGSRLKPQYWMRVDALANSRVNLPKNSKDVKNQLKDTDCLLVNFGIVVDKELIDCAPYLKYIGVVATAYGKIDVAYAKSKNIVVCNLPGYSTNAVGEFAFAALLEHIRDLERAKNQARAGNFSESTFFHVSEIKSKKFGVIGLGNIGGRIAELALGFGADVRYWSRTRKPAFESRGVKFCETEKLLSECDFISLNLTLNKNTENFLDAKKLAIIKPGAILLNLAPNELINFGALEKTLAKGQITYIMDHTDELTEEHAKRLAKYKNCVMYPPIAYTTKGATLAKQEIFVGNVENFLKGKPINVVI